MFIPDNIHEYPDVSLGRGAIFTVPGKFPGLSSNLPGPNIYFSFFSSIDNYAKVLLSNGHQLFLFSFSLCSGEGQ